MYQLYYTNNISQSYCIRLMNILGEKKFILDKQTGIGLWGGKYHYECILDSIDEVIQYIWDKKYSKIGYSAIHLILELEDEDGNILSKSRLEFNDKMSRLLAYYNHQIVLEQFLKIIKI